MEGQVQFLGPVFTAHLFNKLDTQLIDLLLALAPSDWETQTIAPKWRVKDIVAHLLDTALRNLSFGRDGEIADAPSISSNADLVAFIDRLNEDGVRMYGRLSPRLLISLIEVASRQCADYHLSLDPFALARFAVSWAGEDKSFNWFDIAREYTERWHHQQQIRLAVDRPGILTPALYHPVLDCFMRALPFTYKDVTAPHGTLLQFNVSGECGGSWYLHRASGLWQLAAAPVGKKISEITIPQEIAWRVFTKGIDRASALKQTTIEGDANLGLHVLGMTSIVG